MKKEYLIEQSKLIRIETPANYQDLIGKYYLHKLKNGKNCFYRITSHMLLGTEQITLFTGIEGKIKRFSFKKTNPPPFYEVFHTNTEILFNIFD